MKSHRWTPKHQMSGTEFWMEGMSGSLRSSSKCSFTRSTVSPVECTAHTCSSELVYSLLQNSFPHHWCPPAHPTILAMACTDSLLATASCTCLWDWEIECGPFRLKISLGTWTKVLLKVGDKFLSHWSFYQIPLNNMEGSPGFTRERWWAL